MNEKYIFLEVLILVMIKTNSIEILSIKVYLIYLPLEAL